MPYIRQELRPFIDSILDILIERLKDMMDPELVKPIIKDEKELAGCLTYIVFKLLRHFYADGKWYEKMDAVKVVESAIDEYKRRFLHPYEDGAIKRNGDVE